MITSIDKIPDRYGKWADGNFTPIDHRTLEPWYKIKCRVCGDALGSRFVRITYDDLEGLHAFRVTHDWDTFEEEACADGLFDIFEPGFPSQDEAIGIEHPESWSGYEIHVCTRRKFCAEIFYWMTASRRNFYNANAVGGVFRKAIEIGVPLSRPRDTYDSNVVVAKYLDFVARYQKKLKEMNAKYS